jgi:spore coat protein A
MSLMAGAVSAEELLDPVTHPKFVNPLPIPGRLDFTAGFQGALQMRETVQSYGLVDPAGTPLLTTVWGYGNPKDGIPVTSPGPTIVAMRDVPVNIHWMNKLPRYNYLDGPSPHLLPVDPTLHMAHPMGKQVSGIPLVTHLHGGHTESASDGLPEQWFTQNFREVGPTWVKKKYSYDNSQEAATLWYHDHALGITRLNVYAGLAGFYLLRDANEDALVASGVLPGSPYEVEIVIQDRMFDAEGQLFFPSSGAEIEPGFDELPPGPTAIAEFFGDFIMVNGSVWPVLDVEARKYRLRFLNGSDSRFYILEFRDGAGTGPAETFMQIGTDNGLLETPVELTQLLIAPGERADLVVDFSTLSDVVLRNYGPDDPFKGFNPDGSVSDGHGGVMPPADPATTGQIMKFAVNQPTNTDVANATVTVGTPLRPAILPLVKTGETRNLVLFEGLDNYGRLQPLLGTLAVGSQAWFEPITENPMLNDVEIWEVYNATEDAHPIHLHLVSFQIINRESFTGVVADKDQVMHDGSVGVGGKLTVTGLGGDARLPEPNERGWKDTAVMLPGEVTRVIAKFDREGRYVWHCHILSHEDHEMMRPFHVGPMPMAAVAAASRAMTLDGSAPAKSTANNFSLGQNSPNPFNPATEISFQLPVASHVDVAIYDVAGRLIKKLASKTFDAGTHSLKWDGTDKRGGSLASGVYYYRLTAEDFNQTKRMVMVR